MAIPLLSVVIPIYNAEQYLKRMIDSVLNQNFTDFELILINDGSEDGSLDICKKYANIDKRIRVIDKDNEGPSVTRNLGIDNCSGKYLLFLDADDEIELDMFENMIGAAEKNTVDMVVCGISMDVVYKNKVISRIKMHEQNIVLKNNDSVKKYVIETMMRNSIFYAMCNKLYRLDILRGNHIKFQENMDIGEDLMFNLIYVDHVESVQMLDKCFYHYYQYDTGLNLMSKYRDNKFDTIKTWHDELCKISDDINDDETKDYVQWLGFRWMFSCFISVMSSNKSKKEKYNYIDDILSLNCFSTAKTSKNIGMKKLFLEKVISMRNTKLVYLLAKIIYLFKTNLKKLYLINVNNINNMEK